MNAVRKITDDLVGLAVSAQRVINDRPYQELEPALRQGLVYFATRGHPVGGFLTAVLENDLGATIASADPRSLAQIRHLCLFLWNELPNGCYGSKAKVTAWIKSGGLRGQGHGDWMRKIEDEFGDAVASEVYDDHS